MRTLGLIVAVVLGLSGCGTTMHSVSLNPLKASIEFVEHRTFWSTTAVAIVHDGERVLGVGSGTGKPVASFVGDGATTGAVVGGMLFIGTQLPKINTGTSTVTVTGVP